MVLVAFRAKAIVVSVQLGLDWVTAPVAGKFILIPAIVKLLPTVPGTAQLPLPSSYISTL